MNVLKDLFRPKWKHSKTEVRLAAIDSVDDDQLLKQIALDSQHGHVDATDKAVSRIQSQSVVEEIAKLAFSDFDEQERRKGRRHQGWGSNASAFVAAIARLDDHELLREIALDSPSCRARQAALEKLEDPAIAEILLAEDGATSVRFAALELVDDEKKLASVVLAADEPGQSDHRGVKEAAIDKIQNQDLLAEIAATALPYTLLMHVVSRIRDPRALAKVAGDAKSDEVLAMVKRQTGDEETLRVIERRAHELADMRRERDEAQREQYATVELLARRLVEIGTISAHDATARDCASRFLYEAKEEARDIGRRIYADLGHDGMRYAHGIVRDSLGLVAGRELESAWSGVGEWF